MGRPVSVEIGVSSCETCGYNHAVPTTNRHHEVRLTIPARPEYISLCRLALSGLSRVRELTDETLADLKLAITEACSNSVRHAYVDDDGVVEIRYELRPDRLVIEVADNGGGFEPARRGPELVEELSEGGLGMAIIKAIADEFELGPGEEGRGARLRFSKLLAD
jgi:serine/threonine-protein kinase RsbW